MFVITFLTMLPLAVGGISDDVATELRVYDVRALVELQPITDSLYIERRILPLMHVAAVETNGSGGFGRTHDVVEQLMDMFMSADWDDEWSIELLRGGEVHLDAPRGAHERFARLVAVFETAAYDTTAVIVQRFQGPLTLPSGIVNRGVLVAALQSAGIEATSQGLGLDPRRSAVLRDLNAHAATLWVECQIAQSSSIMFGRTRDVLSGLSLELTGEPTRHGVRLGYVLRDTRAQRATDAEAVECITRLFGEQYGLMVDRSGEWNESLQLTGGGAAGQVTLTPDEALVFRVSISGDVADYCAISLDLATRTSASVTFVEIGSEFVAEIVPAGSCQDVRVESSGQVLDPIPSILGRESPAITSSSLNNFPILGAVVHSDISERFERIVGQLESVSTAEVGASTIVLLRAEDRGALDRMLDIGAQFASPRLSVDILATHGESPALRTTLMVDGGSHAVVAVGTERLEVEDYEVEVAQDAAAHLPTVMTRFDGLALGFQFHRLSNGTLAYRARGQFATPTHRQLSTSNEIAGAGLVGTDTVRLYLDERGVAQPVGDGVWRIVFGDRSGQGSSVTLDIRAAR